MHNLKMIKLKRDAQLADIFYEWAADFRHTGNLEQAGFWAGIAMAFRYGSTINADAIEYVKHEATVKASLPFIHADIAKEAMCVLKRLSQQNISGGRP